MRPASRSGQAVLVFIGAAILTGCGGGESDMRPKRKPDLFSAQVIGLGGQGKSLTLATISTKSGQILILEPDGAVTAMALDSAEGQDAFAVSEADLMALNSNLDFDLGGTVTPDLSDRQTTQDKALEDFAARARPALPSWNAAAQFEPDDFMGAHVAGLGPDGATDLVEVTANLREGVDADIAFSYATCVLAGWAKQNGQPYGRHVRTLQDTRDGKLRIGAAFTLSDRKPMGLRVMETDETLLECRARGIPAA